MRGGFFDNNPTFTYVKVKGLTIVYNNNSYPITDIYTNCKYLYWDTSRPNMLIETNIRPTESASIFLICINNDGVHTEIPHDELMYNFNGLGSDGSSLNSNAEFNALKVQVKDNTTKYSTISNTVDGMSRIIGDETELKDGTIIKNLTTIKANSKSITSRVENFETNYTTDAEVKRASEELSGALISMLVALSTYHSDFSSVARKTEVESGDIPQLQTDLDNINGILSTLEIAKDKIIDILGTKEENNNHIDSLEVAFNNVNVKVNSLNSISNSCLSDGSISSSDITSVIVAIGDTTEKVNVLKSTCDEVMILGLGGAIYRSFAETQITSNRILSTVASKNELSKVEQTANKIAWIIKSGTSESSMQLTDKMFTLITDKVLIEAKKIELTGSVNINNGTFTVDTKGNMTANSGTFKGTVLGATIKNDEGTFQVLPNGNMKVGGNTGHTVKGYERAKFEVTSNGTLYSVSETNGKVYTILEEGTIVLSSPDVFNGNDDKIITTTLAEGMIRIGDMEIGNCWIGNYTGSNQLVIDNKTYHNDWVYSDSYMEANNGFRGIGIKSTGSELVLACNNASLTGEDNYSARLKFRLVDGNYYFNPHSDGNVRLGSSSYHWASVWCSQSSMNTSSDRRTKTDISYYDEDDRFEKMFMELKPCVFQKTDSEFGRHHSGFIAQEVEEAMNNNDLDYTDFGALLKTPIDKDGEELNINNAEQMARFVDYEYGLRYGEFTALNTHMIQKAHKEIEELKEIVKQQGELIKQLQEQLNK